jgi:SH3-like domain-containing protein
VSTGASTVTYVRSGDGNLVKVRLPAKDVSSRKANVQAAKAPAATKASTEPAQSNPRRATTLRSDAPAWILPIPRVVRLVAESVAARYGVTVDAILSGERFPNTVRARHEWWRLVRDTWDLSYPETGRLVGGVDHTTILSALREREVGAQVVKNKDASHTRKMSPNRPVGTL